MIIDIYYLCFPRDSRYIKTLGALQPASPNIADFTSFNSIWSIHIGGSTDSNDIQRWLAMVYHCMGEAWPDRKLLSGMARHLCIGWDNIDKRAGFLCLENLDVMEIVATSGCPCHCEATLPIIKWFLTQVHEKISIMQGSAGIIAGILVRSIFRVLNVIIAQCSCQGSTSSQLGYRWRAVSRCFGELCTDSCGIRIVQPPGVGLAWRKRGSGYCNSSHHDVSGGFHGTWLFLVPE
jgi:hypothetical protein